MVWSSLVQGVFVLLLELVLVLGITDISVRVPEESEAGTWIGSIAGSFRPPYRLLEAPAYLRLDQDTGELHVGEQRLDREALCPQQEAPECRVELLGVAGRQHEFVRVLLVVLDINDNEPRFEEPLIRISVPEDRPVGTRVSLDLRATDADAGINGLVRYRLQNDDGFFALGEDGPFLVLVTQLELDRESRNEHRIALVATDCGSPPLSSSTTLLVQVTDVNDNCPVFSPDSPLNATIPEDAPTGTTVAHVTATDADLGVNAAVTYNFSPMVNTITMSLFQLDRDTGLITLSRILSRVDSSEHVLKVLAASLGCTPVSTQLRVRVQRVRAAPVLSIKFIGEHRNQTVLVNENEDPTVLAVLRVSDTASPTTILALANESKFRLRAKDGSYHLLLTEPLDYEQQQRYSLSVKTLDVDANASHSREVARIQVQVLDVNDHVPQFPQAFYRVELLENNVPGTVLLQLHATDGDSGDNGRVQYSLAAASNTSLFSIDRDTGQLSVLEVLDREQQDTYTMEVIAQDKGSPCLTSTTTVTVIVLDANDNSPKFSKQNFEFFLAENVPLWALAGRVSVTDPDAENNGLVDVRLLNHSVPFVLDGERGELRCISPLDREQQDRYELRLLASDRGDPQRSSHAWVKIFLEDVNDNQPRVVVPTTNLSCHVVTPNSIPGTTVANVLATDKDAGNNSELSYTLAACQPPSDSPFRIDKRSGHVTVARQLRASDNGLHQLLVVAEDNGQPRPLHASVWVNLLVSSSVEPCQVREPLWDTPLILAARTPACSLERSVDAGWDVTRLVLLTGLCMVACSVLLFLGAVVVCLSRRRDSQRRRVETQELPLRIMEMHRSEDWID